MSDTPVDAPSIDTTITGLATMSSSTSEHAVNDTGTVHLVIACIFALAVGSLTALVVLILSGMTLPEGLVVGLLGIATTGLGALGGLLASTASKRT